jgi:hypothetical protein
VSGVRFRGGRQVLTCRNPQVWQKWSFKETAGILRPDRSGLRMTRHRLAPDTWHLTPETGSPM